jgi:hypothetical protein
LAEIFFVYVTIAESNNKDFFVVESATFCSGYMACDDASRIASTSTDSILDWLNAYLLNRSYSVFPPKDLSSLFPVLNLMEGAIAGAVAKHSSSAV